MQTNLCVYRYQQTLRTADERERIAEHAAAANRPVDNVHKHAQCAHQDQNRAVQCAQRRALAAHSQGLFVNATHSFIHSFQLERCCCCYCYCYCFRYHSL